MWMSDNIEDRILKYIAEDEYARRNPEINEPNVFSVSTLSWDWHDQVRYKCMKGNHIKNDTNFDMFRGKAIHEYLQRRFVADGWVAEMKLSEYLDGIFVGDKHVRIIGHVDLYDPVMGILIELKSSQWSDKISQSYITQAGAYAVMLMNARFRVNAVHVVKINSKLTRYTLTPDDITNAYAAIVERARLAADEINKCLNSSKRDSGTT